MMMRNVGKYLEVELFLMFQQQQNNCPIFFPRRLTLLNACLNKLWSKSNLVVNILRIEEGINMSKLSTLGYLNNINLANILGNLFLIKLNV